MSWLLYWHSYFIDTVTLLTRLIYWHCYFVDTLTLLTCLLYWHAYFIDMLTLFTRLLYWQRGNIISGEIEPTDSDCEWESDEEEDDEENSIKKIKDVSEEKVFGVPEFWLTTFKNIEFLNDMIQESDYPVMKDLIDVKCELHKLPKNVCWFSLFLNTHIEI